MTSTDTPRTECYVLNPHGPCVSAEFARELERELAEAKQWLNERYKALSEADDRAEKAEAEVERLHAKNEKLAEDLTRADSLVRQSDLMWRKAEAEVERLRATLRRAIEIAEDSTDSLMDWDENRRSETQRKNYAKLEATLNQGNK